MSMNAAILGPALKAAANSAPTDPSGNAVFQAMAEAIISHITSHATIIVNVEKLEGSAGGVMSGTSAAVVTGTGSGTATIA